MMAWTASRDVLKIFVPVHVLNNNPFENQSGVLYGFIFHSNQTICIIGKHSSSDAKHFQYDLQNNGNMIIFGGLITNHYCLDSPCFPDEILNKFMFQLQINENGVQKCNLTKSLGYIRDTIVILYDFYKLKQSQYISSGVSGNDVLEVLVKVQKECDSFRYRVNDGSVFYSVNSIIQYFTCFFYKNIVMVTDGMLKMCQKIRYCRIPLSNNLCTQPAVCEQMKRKFEDGMYLRNRYIKEPCGIHELRMKNFLWKNIVDVCLGLLLMWWFISDKSYCQIVADYMMNLAQLAATELQTLLKWMMGVPAGLKLNSQLDQFLGKFFLYHIYLWTAYLSFIKPVIATSLWSISLCGCLGLSVQVALIQDLLSMMTLHIYCFYVYAARLYSFQVSALSSFWRFFRGKKWNALRQRVDSAQYDVDQLFIGTLLFTILLFLLPTAVLYYVVFLGFRLLVLLIQGALYKMISGLNNTPLYLFLLKICSPDTLTNDIEFHVKREPSVQPYLVMQFKSASVVRLLKDGQMQGSVTHQDSWGALIKKIIFGNLIYPWLDRK